MSCHVLAQRDAHRGSAPRPWLDANSSDTTFPGVHSCTQPSRRRLSHTYGTHQFAYTRCTNTRALHVVSVFVFATQYRSRLRYSHVCTNINFPAWTACARIHEICYHHRSHARGYHIRRLTFPEALEEAVQCLLTFANLCERFMSGVCSRQRAA